MVYYVSSTMKLHRALLRRVLEHRGTGGQGVVATLSTSRSAVDDTTSPSTSTTTTYRSIHSDVSDNSTSWVSCVALERLPVVMPEMPPWEREYKEWQRAWNARRFHELPKTFTTSNVKMGDEGKSSGRAAWEYAPLKTSADVANNVKSLQRKLDQRLFLLVKKDGAWDFLHSVIEKDDVSSRHVAEKAIESLRGDRREDETHKGWYYFIGNAPAAHTVSPGRTNFYHRCQVIDSTSFDPAMMKAFEDYAWVSPDEFEEYLDADLAKVLRQMA